MSCPGHQRPGEQGWTAKAIVQEPVLREQGLLGIVQAERRPHPKAHAEMEQKIGRDEEGDLSRGRAQEGCDGIEGRVAVVGRMSSLGLSIDEAGPSRLKIGQR